MDNEKSIIEMLDHYRNELKVTTQKIEDLEKYANHLVTKIIQTSKKLHENK